MSEWINIPEDYKDYEGMVYMITNHTNNRKYIGKKTFWKKIRRKPLKGKKRVRITRVESDWKKYWGSSKELLSDIEKLGEDKFSREVISLQPDKWSLAYYELEEQMNHGVLFSDEYYNGIINVRLKSRKGSDKDE